MGKKTSINNVTEVVDAVLRGDQSPEFDVNKDGKVDINDVTAAIDNALNPQPEDEGLFNVNGVSFTMVKVEGGKFMMGAPMGEAGSYAFEKPQHQVTIANDYWIGQTQVTQALWKAVMGTNPSLHKGDDKPVEKVSWNDCQEFIARLNQLTGKQFRLPTEAEWEYACIGGKKSKGYKFAGSNVIDNVAWSKANSNGVTHPVKGKQANELGIYDMSGNVNEWCQDWYTSYTASAATDPQGPATGSYKVYRGGSYNVYARDCRSHYRYMMMSNKKYEYLGLRLAL